MQVHPAADPSGSVRSGDVKVAVCEYEPPSLPGMSSAAKDVDV